jgi:hypothetical protein
MAVPLGYGLSGSYLATINAVPVLAALHKSAILERLEHVGVLGLVFGMAEMGGDINVIASRKARLDPCNPLACGVHGKETVGFHGRIGEHGGFPVWRFNKMNMP